MVLLYCIHLSRTRISNLQRDGQNELTWTIVPKMVTHLSSNRMQCAYILFITSGCGARLLLVLAALVKTAPGRAVYDTFVNVWFIKFASGRVASALRMLPVPPVRWPRAICQPHDFLWIGNFATFSELLHIKGGHFPDFFPFKSTYDPYEPWKVSWKSVSTFFQNPKHKHTDRRDSFIYTPCFRKKHPLILLAISWKIVVWF